MLKVGLTGGYASGKSFVAAELERLGCFLIHADKLGHRVLEKDGEAYAPTVNAFGYDILAPDGSVDRRKLAGIVFQSRELLGKLNSFVHPAVFRLEEKELSVWQARNPNGIAVIEAAILIETGRYASFDRLIVTACREETQIARGTRRDGIGPEEALARIAHQLPLEQKKKYANYVIDTDGTKEQTAQQVRKMFDELKHLAETPTH